MASKCLVRNWFDGERVCEVRLAQSRRRAKLVPGTLAHMVARERQVRKCTPEPDAISHQHLFSGGPGPHERSPTRSPGTARQPRG
eukprot:2019937-Pyramimonas_sp.AAC.1